MNLALFVGTIWIMGEFVYRATRSSLFTTLAGLALALSPVLIPVHSWAMSEPLSIFLGFLGLLLLFMYLLNEKDLSGIMDGVKAGCMVASGRKGGELNHPYSVSNWLLLIGSGFATGLATLTRYGSIAFVITGIFCVLLFSPRRWKQRMLDVLLYSFLGFVPVAVWMIFDLVQTNAVSQRSILAGTTILERAVQLWPLMQREVFLFWLVPESWIYAPRYPMILNQVIVPLALVVLVLWTILVFLVLRRHSPSRVLTEKRIALSIMWLFVIVYIFVMAVVYLTTYPPITIGSRMFAPIHIAVLSIVCILIDLSLTIWKNPLRLKSFFVCILVIFIGIYGFRSARIVRYNFENGLGFNSVSWQTSETVNAVKALPEDIIIVTNEETALLYLLGRASYPLAEIYRETPLQSFTSYGNGDLTGDKAQQYFRKGAALVLFDSIDDQLQSLYGDRTDERISSLVNGLHRAFRGSDGGIFYYSAQ